MAGADAEIGPRARPSRSRISSMPENKRVVARGPADADGGHPAPATRPADPDPWPEADEVAEAVDAAVGAAAHEPGPDRDAGVDSAGATAKDDRAAPPPPPAGIAGMYSPARVAARASIRAACDRLSA